MKSPILLITYKRLDTTKKVMESIQKYAPEKLYVFSDGARDIERDEQKVNEVRNYIKENITWDCQLVTFFSDKNLGCKYGPQNAISWFFDNEERGIILEDDTVPEQSFYHYCEELLEHYADDLRVWNISGTNTRLNSEKECSYHFSRFPHTWGWATWANRWKTHIDSLKDFNRDCERVKKINMYVSKAVIENWSKLAQISFEDKLDAWDYIWSFRIFMSHGLSIVPKNNLILNIGFGEDATHTVKPREHLENELVSMEFPLTHPGAMVPSFYEDEDFFENYFHWKPLRKKFSPGYVLKFLRSRLKI